MLKSGYISLLYIIITISQGLSHEFIDSRVFWEGPDMRYLCSDVTANCQIDSVLRVNKSIGLCAC